MTQDFAKIVRASCGLQVLFYVEPSDGNYTLHQIVNMQGAQADLALGFNSRDKDANKETAFAIIEKVNVKYADLVIEEVHQITGREHNALPESQS